MGDDGKLSGVARLERGQTSATFEQNLHAEVRPVPYDNRVTQHRLHTRHGWEQLRNEIAQLRNEIVAGRESADAQMRELRGYIVQHLEQHGRDGE